jgi:hypothetical protein
MKVVDESPKVKMRSALNRLKGEESEEGVE